MFWYKLGWLVIVLMIAYPIVLFGYLTIKDFPAWQGFTEECRRLRKRN
jgi:hypothetical protein